MSKVSACLQGVGWVGESRKMPHENGEAQRQWADVDVGCLLG